MQVSLLYMLFILAVSPLFLSGVLQWNQTFVQTSSRCNITRKTLGREHSQNFTKLYKNPFLDLLIMQGSYCHLITLSVYNFSVAAGVSAGHLKFFIVYMPHSCREPCFCLFISRCTVLKHTFPTLPGTRTWAMHEQCTKRLHKSNDLTFVVQRAWAGTDGLAWVRPSVSW